jgi:hypothetical protein
LQAGVVYALPPALPASLWLVAPLQQVLAESHEVAAKHTTIAGTQALDLFCKVIDIERRPLLCPQVRGLGLRPLIEVSVIACVGHALSLRRLMLVFTASTMKKPSCGSGLPMAISIDGAW